MKMGKKELEIYDYMTLKEMDERVAKRTAKSKLEEALQRGLEQGIEQGFREKAIEDTKKMLKENLGIKLISRITGLSVDEIEKLK